MYNNNHIVPYVSAKSLVAIAVASTSTTTTTPIGVYFYI